MCRTICSATRKWTLLYGWVAMYIYILHWLTMVYNGLQWLTWVCNYIICCWFTLNYFILHGFTSVYFALHWFTLVRIGFTPVLHSFVHFLNASFIFLILRLLNFSFLPGFCIDLLLKLANRTNITYDLHLSADKQFGSLVKVSSFCPFTIPSDLYFFNVSLSSMSCARLYCNSCIFYRQMVAVLKDGMEPLERSLMGRQIWLSLRSQSTMKELNTLNSLNLSNTKEYLFLCERWEFCLLFLHAFNCFFLRSVLQTEILVIIIYI